MLKSRLQQAFLALDPVRLFEQVKDLQQALFVHAVPVFADAREQSDGPVQRFGVEACLAGAHVTNPLTVEPITEQHEESEQPPSMQVLLDWPRTRHDPFKEEWELIASWVLAHPERGSGELFRELQRQFPGRYQPSHLRTLQRGVRKIRARLRASGGSWQQEMIAAYACARRGATSHLPARSRLCTPHQIVSETFDDEHGAGGAGVSGEPKERQATTQGAGMASDGAASVPRVSARGMSVCLC